MKREIISKGMEITTEIGYLKVKGYNGSIVYVDEITDDEDGNEITEEKKLTLEEIGHEMKAVDGKNHDLRWEGNRW